MAFLDFLLSVRGLVIALIACVWWLHTRPMSAAARHALVWIVTAFTLASVYIVPYAAVRILAHGYRSLTPADVPPGATAIVVLSAGNITVVDRDKESFSILEPVSAARVLEAARVFKMLPRATVISSGGRIYDDDDSTQPSALTMRDALDRLGHSRVADRPRDRVGGHARRGRSARRRSCGSCAPITSSSSPPTCTCADRSASSARRGSTSCRRSRATRTNPTRGSSG